MRSKTVFSTNIWKLSLLANFAWFFLGVGIPSATPQKSAEDLHSATGKVNTVASLPILVVYNSAYPNNKFGRFLGEIMKAEGFHYYATEEVANLTPPLLANYDSIVLAETSLTPTQAAMLSQYVFGGGNLIAMRPDPQLSSTMGLGLANGVLVDGYIAIQTNSPYGQGFPSDSLQLHTNADLYSNNTAQILALLYSNASIATGYPAITLNQYGNGKAVAFTYDLASSVVYLRQGNSNQVDVDADGDGVVRIMDIYYNWINLDKMPLPQADLQQRFFARLLEKLNATKKPLPRLWYFPNAKNTALVLTSDAHGNPDSYYANLITGLNVHNATTTFYLAQASQPSAANVINWKTQGFTFSTHPYEETNSLSVGYDNVDAWFNTIHGPRTTRTVRIHRVKWQGWTDAAVIGASRGYLMDYTPYRYGSWLKKADNSWARGYMTGSGLPMKYINISGQIIDYFGQYTEIVDEQIAYGPEGLNDAEAYLVTQQAIDASENGNYQAVVFQMHVDNNGLFQWQGNAIGYARGLSVPVLNGESWLNFVEARYNSSIDKFSWNGTQLNFTVNIPATQTGQTIMLPLRSGTTNLTNITVNTTPAAYTVKTVNGEQYAFIILPAGSSNVSVTYPYNKDCDPLFINNASDSIPGGECDITIRKALDSAAINGGTVRLNKDKLTTNPVVINLNSPLVIAANVKIDGECSTNRSGLRLNANFPEALQLVGHNFIKGVALYSNSSSAIKISSSNNTFNCTYIRVYKP